MTGRLYLDVDGVFNAVTAGTPQWGWEGAVERVQVNGYPITYSPELVAVINEAAASPGVETYWLTTWCHDAVTHLAPALGINGADWPVVGYDHWRKATGLPWWKHLAIVEHLDDFDGPVLWIDDDHGVDPACRAWLAGQPQILALRPRTELGVTKRQAEIIRRFVTDVVCSPASSEVFDAE